MVAGKGSKDSSSEERASAANYIITFYNEVSQLTGYYAQYFNLLMQVKEKYADISKMDEQEKAVLITAVQNIRYHTQTVYIQYKCIAENLNIDAKEEMIKVKLKDGEKDLTLNDLYNLVRNVFIIKVEDLENFVTLLNKILVKNVMKNLLENSQNIVESVFKDPEEKKAA